MIRQKTLRYLFLLPIVTMIAFCAVFGSLLQASDKAILAEKRMEKKLSLDLVCEQIDIFVDLDQDWQPSYQFYEDSLSLSMDILDSMDMTFAALYNEDLIYIPSFTVRQKTPLFQPELYPEFINAVHHNERGEIMLINEVDSIAARDVYVYYRWVPTDKTLEGRFLTVVAISSRSVRSRVSNGLVAWIIGLILITTALNFALVAMLCKLGDVYENRASGDKWRKG
ncbi:hypothetical protein AGMMS49992_21420 [Clostridia bacterium]|nr:hypothetical protein AGMMS49992_21420 [Clostridia bacterium]